jgi:chromosome segregation ATPase
MVVLNLAVDQSYLSGQINNNQKEMKTLASRVDGEIAENNEKIAQEIEKLSIQEDSKGAELALLLHEEKDLSGLVSTKENELEKARSKLGLADRYFDPSLDKIKESLSERKSTLKKKTNQIEGIQKGLKTIGEDISSKEEAISASGTISIATARKALSGSAKYFKNQVEVLLDMMILFMMKTVIFPLLFMYLLTKGFKLIWGVDVRTLIKREQKI